MSKWIKFGLLSVLAVTLVFAGVSVAAAQSDDPPVDPPAEPFGPRHGPGMGPKNGPLAKYHEIVDQALADALGISLAEIEAARDEGLTIFELAEANDVDLEELRAVLEVARGEMVEQALQDGVISQEQAEWLEQAPGPHGPRMGGCDGEGPRFDGTGEFGPRGGRWGGNAQ